MTTQDPSSLPPGVTLSTPPIPDFEFLDGVEWGLPKDDEGYDTDQEYAPRPRRRQPEVCHCPPGSSCLDDSCLLHACFEECTLHRCPAGLTCQNVRLQLKQFAAVEIFDAGPKGRGLRLTEPVRKGDLLVEYTGQAVRAKHLKRLFRRYQWQRQLYILALDHGVYIDARYKGGAARFINHSCHPNCRMERWNVKGVLRAAVVALRPLPAGTELTFDYQWERQPGRAGTKCHCGSANCRGTLEVGADWQRQQEELLLQDDTQWLASWKQPDHTLLNRVVQVWDADAQAYQWGEVTGYDPDTQLHQVLYRHSVTEVWEDLQGGDAKTNSKKNNNNDTKMTDNNDDDNNSNNNSKTNSSPKSKPSKRQWRVLNDINPSQFHIAKKKLSSGHSSPQEQSADAGRSSSPHPNNHPTHQSTATVTNNNNHISNSNGTNINNNNNNNNNATTTLVSSSISSKQHYYVYVPTAVKEKLWAKHYIERCQRCCGGVQISAQRISQSNRNKAFLAPNERPEREAALHNSPDGVVWKLLIVPNNNNSTTSSISTDDHNASKARDMLAKTAAQLESVALDIGGHGNIPAVIEIKTVESVILPRTIVEGLKRKLPVLRDKCRGTVLLQWASSDSKSKKFSRLTLEHDGNGINYVNGNGSNNPAMTTAKEHLWKALEQLCTAPDVERVQHTNLPKHLGWSAGTLSQAEFELLWHNNRNNTKTPRTNGRLASKPTLTKTPSRPLLSTECCEPASPFLRSFEMTYRCLVWIQTAEDQGRVDSNNQLVALPTNTRQVYLGCEPAQVASLWKLLQDRVQELQRGIQYYQTNRLFLPLFRNNAGLAGFLQRVTGCAVSLDSITGDHLRLDGTQSARPHAADLARDILQLQWASFQESCQRESAWIFGRDWATITDWGSTSASSTTTTSRGYCTIAAAGAGAVEIAEIVKRCKLPGSVALHAITILYRYAVILDKELHVKTRDALLACVFLANKAHKASKPLKLDTILHEGYATFYGSVSSEETREIQVLSGKILQVEQDILETLQYDVFVRGTGGPTQLARTVLDDQDLDNAWKLTGSGPVLGAGAELWLKYGLEYVFAACSILLGQDWSRVIPALHLTPIKVQQAAQLLVETGKWGKASSKYAPTHPLAEKRSADLQALLRQHVDTTALVRLPRSSVPIRRVRRVLVGIPVGVISSQLVPVLRQITEVSGVRVATHTAAADSCQVVLEGSWRAVAAAEHLIRERLPVPFASHPLMDDEAFASSTSGIQAFRLPVKRQCPSVSSTGVRVTEGGTKSLLRATIQDEQLRWMIPTKGLSLTGALDETHYVYSMPNDSLQALRAVAPLLLPPETLPHLCSNHSKESSSKDPAANELSVRVTLQRWPPEKIEQKEQAEGFSAMCLQEMQLLTELHGRDPEGHPNFVLPLALVQASGETEKPGQEEELFSLFRTSEQNNLVADGKRRVQSSPHLASLPVLFSINRKCIVPPTLLQCWCYDILSALAHCHRHNVLIRNWQPDHIVVLEDGRLVFNSLYRCTVLSEPTRDPLEMAKMAKGKRSKELVTPYTAPELLLGCPQHSFATDIWACGCLLAQLTVNKTIFSGKDKQSLLQAQYKIVGTPSKENYNAAVKYPHFTKFTKKYHRGVGKALLHMQRHRTKAAEKSPMIEIVEQMLCLDPVERLTADQALAHPYFTSVRECTPEFRQAYAAEWVEFAKQTKGQERSHERKLKRKALMMAAAVTSSSANGDVGDDLYAMDDDLMLEPSKKLKPTP